tara:strand:- start:2179 stop:2553 length:375 start_codon:yes stop_codon:yes gene_type:complete
MLKPPAYAPNAKPTVRGWVDHKTGELLVSRKHSDRDVEEYHIAKAGPIAPVPAPAPTPAPKPIIEADPEPAVEETAEMLTEADPVDYSSMTKAQLAEHAYETHGIDLDTTMTKSTMIRELESQL